MQQMMGMLIHNQQRSYAHAHIVQQNNTHGQPSRPTMPHFLDEPKKERKLDTYADLMRSFMDSTDELRHWTLGSGGLSRLRSVYQGLDHHIEEGS